MLHRAAWSGLFVLLAVVIVCAQTSARGSGPASASQTAAAQATSATNQSSAPGNSQDGPTAVSAAGDRVVAGTAIHAVLDTPLSARTSRPGDRFTATICEPVRGQSGLVVIPSGARMEGEVAEADDGKATAALRGKGALNVRFRNVVLPGGETLPLTATLISVHDTTGRTAKKADGAGMQSSPRANDGARGDAAGIGAGGDTVSGLVFGGTIKGLAIGAQSGGGYILSRKGRDVSLPAQTGMVIRLDQPMSWSGTEAQPQK